MIRALAVLLMLLTAAPAMAQYLVSSAGCVRPGGGLAVAGSFGGVQVGDIILAETSSGTVLRVRGWTASRIRVSLPQGVRPDRYSLVWRQVPSALPGSPQWVQLGDVTVCATPGGRGKAPRDVVAAPGGGAEYVVSVAPREAAAAARVLQERQVDVIRTTPLPQLGRVLLIVSLPADLSLTQARQLLEQVAPSARIDFHHIYGFADGPRLYAAALVGDDPGRLCAVGSAVKIGMIDGPINPNHKALNGVETITTNVLQTGESPVSADHGTAVAALIAGRTATFGGFAPGARIYAVTAFAAAKGGGARLEAIAQVLDWLAGQGVSLVNLSMEGSPNAAFEDILSGGRNAGLVMIAAAGNEGTSEPRYPAASPSAIAVTAVDATGQAYGSANTGAHIQFAAPGVDLYVAKGAGGGYRSGTSYAAPIVTALVARLAGGSPSLDGARRALQSGARDLGPAGRDTQFGFGLVQTGGC